MRRLALALLAALAAGPVLAQGAPAQGSPTPAAPSRQPGGAAAYPGSPGGQPAAERGGRPVATDHGACPAGGCPAAPGPSGAADASRTAAPSSSVGQAGPLPSTAYPDAPGGLPSNRPDGLAPR